MMFAFILVLCIMGMVFADDSDVVILDAGNFEHLTQASTGATTGDWLIKFYAPWCGHCKKLTPVWEEVATRLAGDVNVAKVDVTNSRALGTRFNIKGFPTLLFFRQGNVYKYKGKRSADDLIDFVQGGYTAEAIESEPVPLPLGFFGPVVKIFEEFKDIISKTIARGDFFSPIMIAIYLFLLLLFVFILMLILPGETVPKPRMKAD